MILIAYSRTGVNGTLCSYNHNLIHTLYFKKPKLKIFDVENTDLLSSFRLLR